MSIERVFHHIVVPTDFSSCAEEAWALAQRLARALDAEHSDTAIVIVSYPFDLDKQQLTSELVFEPLERFPNAIQVDESYVVYRAKKVRIEHRS